MSRAPISDELAARLRAIANAVTSADPRLSVRLNRNRRILLSLRYDRRGGGTLSLHHALLDEGAALAELPGWVRQGGRGSYPAIRSALIAVAARLGAQGAPAAVVPAGIETIGEHFDLEACYAAIHARFFPHLARPTLVWSRNGRRGAQTHIRFGCYRRSPSPQISVHPRLRQPWVARVFVEHVLFHELCHHAQASRPMRGEAMHGERFRTWERLYPHHDLALAWERASLTRLLAAPPSES